MNTNPQFQLLNKAITKAIQKINQKNQLNPRDLMEALCLPISDIAAWVSSKSPSLDQLILEEQTMMSLVMQAIHPFFESKRQILLSQLPTADAKLFKEKTLQQTKQMISNKNMTPDEGLSLAGELLSIATYLRGSSVQNLAQVKEIETKTLNHIKDKLNLALEAIQVEQGFLTKQS